MVQALSFGLFSVNTNICQGQVVRQSHCRITLCSPLIFVVLNGLKVHTLIWRITKSGLYLLLYQQKLPFP